MQNFFALWYKQETARFVRGIWDKYWLMIFQNSPNTTCRPGGSCYFGEFLNITCGIYPKYPLENVLFPILILVVAPHHVCTVCSIIITNIKLNLLSLKNPDIKTPDIDLNLHTTQT